MKNFTIGSKINWQGQEEVTGSIHVTDCKNIVGSEEPITDLKDIKITFDYPLGRPIQFSFHSDNGFTKQRFWEAVNLGYTKIYEEETHVKGRAKRGADYPECILLNRKETNGPYGVWGHCMGDLILEGITESKPGVFRLNMGS